MATGTQIVALVIALVGGGAAGFGLSRASAPKTPETPQMSAVAESTEPITTTQTQTLETAPSEVREVLLTANNTTGGPKSTAQYLGALYSPELAVEVVQKTQWSTETPEAAFMGMYSAFRIQDTTWAKELVAEEEREAYQTRLDSGYVTGEDETLHLSEGATIVERVDFGNFAIIIAHIAQQDGYKQLMLTPFVRTSTGWFRTLKLDQQAVMAVVSAMAAKRYK